MAFWDFIAHSAPAAGERVIRQQGHGMKTDTMLREFSSIDLAATQSQDDSVLYHKYTFCQRWARGWCSFPLAEREGYVTFSLREKIAKTIATECICFAFADGSVRLLRYSANPIMPALATRAGGEVVTVE